MSTDGGPGLARARPQHPGGHRGPYGRTPRQKPPPTDPADRTDPTDVVPHSASRDPEPAAAPTAAVR
ncbi:hypothetical protein [Streptomyces venezuelae]|uniref:hypothetical protein n=1 Tax=Streptomyces venezuelae TaxID=54571 RepID=UPI001CC24BDB|nr:hypothetical protein [Streptomyces venezuelae]